MSRFRCILRLVVVACALATSVMPGVRHAAAEPAKPLAASPFNYVRGTAHHIPPETTTDESGYFSLNEGLDGKLYVGTTAYGRNAYLVEFDPKTLKMRAVLDAHKRLGLPLTPTGYAAQAKFHTRNFTAPSGKVYVGTKQGYATKEDEANKVQYPGGYVMVYDPKTGETENLGMPFPTQGIIDVVADEERGLVYAVTCEDQHWMVYDVKTKKWTEPDPALRLTSYATTLWDPSGTAVAITKAGKLARYQPTTGKVTQANLVFADDKQFDESLIKGPLTWVQTPDRKTAYLIAMSRPNLFRIDLTPAGENKAAPIVDLGPMIGGKGHDSRCGITLAADGRLYAIIRINNDTGWGGGHLHHIVRYDPKAKPQAAAAPAPGGGPMGDAAPTYMEDLGVLVIKNPDFYGLPLGKGAAVDPATGKARNWTHGYHLLPDGALTPLHAHMALLATSDGGLAATILYPFTLVRIPADQLAAKPR